MSEKSMKKREMSERDTLRPDYAGADLGRGERGKHFSGFRAGTNLVLLAPDVAEVFPTPEAVNAALRSLITIAEQSTRSKQPAKPRDQ